MTSIGKYILLLGVSMQIDEHVDPLLILEDMPFYVKDLLTFLKLRRLPASIEVVTCEIAAGVA